jgi:hypothetical protein
VGLLNSHYNGNTEINESIFFSAGIRMIPCLREALVVEVYKGKAPGGIMTPLGREA